MKQLFSILTIALSLISPTLDAKSIIIHASPVGQDEKPLFYLDDFQISVFADGNSLSTEDYRVMPSADDKLKVKILSVESMSTLMISFSFFNYRPASRNINLAKQSSDVVFLGRIAPTPNPLMISSIRYFSSETDPNENDLMEFEVTFLNNTGNSIQISDLEISAYIESKCNSPSPVFARIKIDREIQYYTNQAKQNVAGTVEEGQRKSRIRGSINYEECGTQQIHLGVPLSAIILAERHSQMIIQIPNTLTVHETDNTGNVHSIEYQVVSEEGGNIENLYSIFSRVPNISFKFEIDAPGQSEITTTYQDYFRP